MINGCCLKRKNKCRRKSLMMVGVTLSFTLCLYMLGAVVLSPVKPTNPRVYRNNQGTGREGTGTGNSDFPASGDRFRGKDGSSSWYIDNEHESKYHHDMHVDFNVKNKTKRLPQAIIIGVKKAGTRALLEYLRLHPNVKAPGPEPHFFDKHYEKGLKWYRNQMPETFKGQLTIEKTPSYFVTKGIPERVYRMSKKTKLIVVFRDPVTRAISDYAQLASRNPDVKSFDEMAFPNNETMQVDTSWTIIKIGVYAQHLTRWIDYFPMQQIHFVSGESLIENPALEMKRIQDFLGLEQYITAENFTFNHTKGFPCYRRDTSKDSWHCLNEEKGRHHPNISLSTRKRLEDFYRPFNVKLYRMTGQDYGWS